MAILLGGATSDCIRPNITTSSTAVTYFARMNPSANTSNRRLWQHTSYVSLRWVSGSVLRWQRTFDTQAGQWDFPAWTGDSAIAIGHDGSSTVNTPVMYRDGTQQTATLNQTPLGTVSTGSSGLFIGNTTFSGGSSAFQGSFAEFAIWNELLSAETMRMLTAGDFSPLMWPHGLIYYNPLVDLSSASLVGLKPDFNGCAAEAHPLIRRPVGVGI